MPISRAVPPHAVDRPALRSRLDIGIEAPLTLLVAPAGSGKTVLLTQWVASLRDVRVAWFEMTGADDDAVRFARRFVEGLAELDPCLADLGAALGNAGGGLGEPMLESLAAAFAEVGQTVVVVFDDLHHLANTEIVSDLWRLVDLLPPHVHFVFSSRVDLKLGWSRHRLQHGLVEIRQAQLAFDADSTRLMLERITRLPVDDATAATVVERTEGWAAGVQMTGLTLRFRDDPGEMWEALAESDRLAVDYLSEEVLDAQSGMRRRALLDLSVLDEISPPLAEAVAGVADGDAFLRELRDESMFVVALEGRPGHYRFHHLFRDLLRYRLRAADPKAESALLQTAAQWYLTQGNVGAAIECLLRGHCWDQALDMILARGREVYERGESATGARWLARVPATVRAQRVEAELLYAILEGMSGRAALAEDLLRAIIALPDVPPGVALVARSFVSTGVQFLPHPEVYMQDGMLALEMAAQSPTVIPPDLMHLTDVALLQVLVRVAVARAHLMLGDTTAAVQLLESTLATEGGRYGAYRIHGLGSLALAHAWAGRLTLATELADEALDLARELDLLTHPGPADAYLARALVAILHGEPEAGAFAVHEGYVRASANSRTQLMWIAHAESLVVDPDGSDPAKVPPPGTPPPIVQDALRALARRKQRVAGNASIGVVAAATPGAWSPMAFEDIAALLSKGDAARARDRLDMADAADPATPASTVERGILRAWLAAVEERPSEAREYIVAALDAAEAEQLVHPFLRAGAEVLDLVARLPGTPSGFRRVVLDRSATLQHDDAPQLIEPLTGREMELLAYLPSRLTNAELAARCFVSVNTVKTHMAHIYRKLDASGRDAAIARARELGLLDARDIAHIG